MEAANHAPWHHGAVLTVHGVNATRTSQCVKDSIVHRENFFRPRSQRLVSRSPPVFAKPRASCRTDPERYNVGESVVGESGTRDCFCESARQHHLFRYLSNDYLRGKCRAQNRKAPQEGWWRFADESISGDQCESVVSDTPHRGNGYTHSTTPCREAK